MRIKKQQTVDKTIFFPDNRRYQRTNSRQGANNNNDTEALDKTIFSGNGEYQRVNNRQDKDNLDNIDEYKRDKIIGSLWRQ